MANHDLIIATRFNIFRKKCVANSMVEAGKIFGCSHSKISDIETGKRPVDLNFIIMLANNYDLNTNWLSTGEGSMLRGIPDLRMPESDTITHDEKLTYMRIATDLLGFGFNDQGLDLLVSTYDLILKNKGETDLKDIAKVKQAVKDRFPQDLLADLTPPQP